MRKAKCADGRLVFAEGVGKVPGVEIPDEHLTFCHSESDPFSIRRESHTQHPLIRCIWKQGHGFTGLQIPITKFIGCDCKDGLDRMEGEVTAWAVGRSRKAPDPFSGSDI